MTEKEKMKTFWDFCARFYDFAQLQNSAYKKAVDFVLAPQVLHLLDNPQKAAMELRRICANRKFYIFNPKGK